MHAYLITVLGLIFFFEGIPYLASPKHSKKLLNWILSASTPSLRILGAALMVAGLLLVYLGRKNGG
jgi:uncharacterized protein YjeT (DUF2065 family)